MPVADEYLWVLAVCGGESGRRFRSAHAMNAERTHSKLAAGSSPSAIESEEDGRGPAEYRLCSAVSDCRHRSESGPQITSAARTSRPDSQQHVLSCAQPSAVREGVPQVAQFRWFAEHVVHLRRHTALCHELLPPSRQQDDVRRERVLFDGG